jgi:hypothetical protein
MPRLRMRGGTLLLPQYDFIAWCLVKPRDDFNLLQTYHLLDKSRAVESKKCKYET